MCEGGTRLHLKRGKRYGVCGYNGCGKSTLMKVQAHFDAPICHPDALHARMQTARTFSTPRMLAVSLRPFLLLQLPLLSLSKSICHADLQAPARVDVRRGLGVINEAKREELGVHLLAGNVWTNSHKSTP
jgi:energy-coupling factor transporter ATP-binding protein EcfA2